MFSISAHEIVSLMILLHAGILQRLHELLCVCVADTATNIIPFIRSHAECLTERLNHTYFARLNRYVH